MGNLIYDFQIVSKKIININLISANFFIKSYFYWNNIRLQEWAFSPMIPIKNLKKILFVYFDVKKI